MYSNAHVHLRGDLDKIINQAQTCGVELVLAAGIDLQSSIEAVKIAKSYDVVYACVGIHPWNADKLNQVDLKKLRGLTREEKVVAISEIGLDFVSRRDTITWSREKPLPREMQRKAFQNQVRLAKTEQLPIILHERNAQSEILEILRLEGASELGRVIHGFEGNLEAVKEYTTLGFYITVGRAIAAPDNIPLEDVVKEVPIEQLFTETDGGDPVDVIDIAKKIAKLKRISKEKVGRITTSTLKTLLKL